MITRARVDMAGSDGYRAWAVTIEERTIINLGVYVFQGEENRNGPGPQQRELFASRGIKELSEWEEVQASQWMVDLDIPDSLIPQR